MVMSGRSINLTTLFLGRLRPPKLLTSTKCTYFRQQLTPAQVSGRNERMWPGLVLNPEPLVLESDPLPTASDSPADQESNLTIILFSLPSFSIDLTSLRNKTSTVKMNPLF